MSTTRLTFLYPHLFRSVRISDSAANIVRARTQPTQAPFQAVRGFTTSNRRARQTSQRHGKAVEPYPIGGNSDGGANNTKVLIPDEGANETQKGKEGKEGQEGKESNEKSTGTGAEKSQQLASLSEDLTSKEDTNAPDTNQLGAGAALESTPNHQPSVHASDHPHAHETVLEMPPPKTPDQEDATKPPHLQTPRYVHHFDTYTLVQQVEAGDFTTKQSITAMKAVRALLAHNLDIAKAGLVSKSDVENVRSPYFRCPPRSL